MFLSHAAARAQGEDSRNEHQRPCRWTGAHLAEARIEQLTVLIADRTVSLPRALRARDAQHIRLCSVTVLDGTEDAVLRLVVDRPSVAAQLLEAEGYSVCRRELLAVALAERGERERGIRGVLQVLLAVEIAVTCIYSLASQVDQQSVLALDVEAEDWAEVAMVEAGLALIDQDQLGWGEDPS